MLLAEMWSSWRSIQRPTTVGTEVYHRRAQAPQEVHTQEMCVLSPHRQIAFFYPVSIQRPANIPILLPRPIQILLRSQTETEKQSSNRKMNRKQTKSQLTGYEKNSKKQLNRTRTEED